MRRLLHEPLLHFLFLGVGLFLVFNGLNPGAAEDPKRIDVTRADLLTFMQYRARAINGQQLEAQLAQMSADQWQQLIDDYVREEAMYREARALGLDNYDYSAKRRLVQRLEYTLQGLRTAAALSEEDLQSFYQSHQAAYYKAAEITFTHVFIALKNTARATALQHAQATLQELKQQQVPFHRAPAYGDRFVYHTNYVDRGPDEVASHFGDDFQQQLFALTPDTFNRWQGPFQSEYGFHLVNVTRLKPGYQPELDEIRARLVADVEQQQRREALDKTIDRIVDGYTIRVDKTQFAVPVNTDTSAAASPDTTVGGR